MLQIHIKDTELFDEEKEEFLFQKARTLNLEHSLLSVSKWEAKWHKPFIRTRQEKRTTEEVIDYVRCMCLDSNVDPLVFRCLTKEDFIAINKYIDDPMTATWFNKNQQRKSNSRAVTSELIYYWMISLEIPFECQKWHLNRLMTLIRVCNEENRPKKKMGKGEILKNNAALNAARRKQMGSRG